MAGFTLACKTKLGPTDENITTRKINGLKAVECTFGPASQTDRRKAELIVISNDRHSLIFKGSVPQHDVAPFQ